jgi:hypothetical protein
MNPEDVLTSPRSVNFRPALTPFLHFATEEVLELVAGWPDTRRAWAFGRAAAGCLPPSSTRTSGSRCCARRQVFLADATRIAEVAIDEGDAFMVEGHYPPSSGSLRPHLPGRTVVGPFERTASKVSA